MNWTCKLLAVALATVALFSLDFHAQTTNSHPRHKEPRMSRESGEVCELHQHRPESGVPGEPYDDGEAYEIYSAIIPTVAPDPETNMWFIGIDTSPIGHGSLPDGARELWEKTRGADTALDDYFKVNARHWLLQGNFTLPKPYRLVTQDELKAGLPRNSIKVFTEHWIELSPVGFNADRTMAVVYMGHYCTSDGCGGGKSYVLQKHFGKWKVLTWWQCWIS
jgi:hypothetical protein